MDRFFRRLAIIAALVLAVFGVMATALTLGFPETPRYVWQIIVWVCAVSLAILFAWFVWEMIVFTREWRHALLRGWEFRWPITKKQDISSDNNLTRGLPISPESFLAPQDAYYLHDTAAEGYPHKLKIVLRNDSDGDFIVTSAEWQDTWNLTLPPLNEHLWQPEGPRGWQNDDWGGETHEALVRPGRAIQTWVGLPSPLGEVELRRRIMTKRLGTLIVPVTIDGHTRRTTLETIKL